MKIGINALFLRPGEVGGSEIYLRSLLPLLTQAAGARGHTVRLFLGREARRELGPLADAAPPAPPARWRAVRILWEQLVLPFQVKAAGLDVLFSPGLTAPLLLSCPSVVTVYDLQHLRHPEHFRWFDLPFWNLLVARAAGSAGAVITLSQHSRRDLEQYYRLDPERLHVIPLACGAEFRPAEPADAEPIAALCARLGIQRPFLLSPGTTHPHKNYAGLIAALEPWWRQRDDPMLVITGVPGLAHRQLERLLRERGLSGRVRLTGWLPRSELPLLFRAAELCVLPSLFEGFGLPALEALASGVPLVCSRAASLPEVVGDAAILVDAEDPARLRDAIERGLRDPALRAELSRRGPLQARRFSWAATAAATLQVLEAAAAQHRVASAAPQRQRQGLP
ncbi:MAG TPA: glycosyltransferase family 1 protein [Acidobacteriota bacterium]